MSVQMNVPLNRKLNSDLVAGQVRQWVATHDISVDKEKLECIPIQANDLRIRDLSPIFGYPYLYQVSHVKNSKKTEKYIFGI